MNHPGFVSLVAGTLLTSCATVLAEPATVIQWNFDQPDALKSWAHPNHIQDLRVEDGALCGRIMDWDPFVRGPQFEIAATPYQRIEIRIKTDCDGYGDLFWTNTTQSSHGGFSADKKTPFRIFGDGLWHEYHVYPFWHKEQKIILLRLDFPKPLAADHGAKTFAVDYIRIVDLGKPDVLATQPKWDFTGGTLGWHGVAGGVVEATSEGVQLAGDEKAAAYMLSGALQCPIQDHYWVNVQMKADKGSAGYVKWVSSSHAGMQSVKFPITADGEFHNYNLDMSAYEGWAGDALLLGLQPTNAAGATAIVRNIALGDNPAGGCEIECSYLGLEAAINRAGQPATLVMNLVNRGGTATTATDIRIDELDLPQGVSVADDDDWRSIPAMEPFDPVVHRIRLKATSPIKGQIVMRLSGKGAPKLPLTGVLTISEPLDLPQADYVPKPQPLESDYEIGAFYYPGWQSTAKWHPVQTHAPARKPVLGWYDESNPQCVDWQIKWAVEHGIKFLLVDWYWNAGSRHAEHWLHAYERARYRSDLKWAMMWANHNRAGSHSEEDMRNVAKFWVDHYFGMPEYMRIEDKPVVMIWSPANIRRDLGGKRALEIARQIAKEAGYKGIYFIAMKWPEASADPGIIGELADDGYDMTSIYHYMHHGGQAEDPTHFPFELVARSSADHWRSRHQAGGLPFLPNLSTGWDSRPWHGDRATVIHSRSVELFRQICEDAKRFADETGVKRLVLAPLNEWGEGSYAEPNKEFGFGMYDALRDVFCKQPSGGWPPNVVPSDIGLGPYDLPQPALKTDWQFNTDGDLEGWAPNGTLSAEVRGGLLVGETAGHDPILHGSVVRIQADITPRLIIRMRSDTDDQAQLFWGTNTSRQSERNSLRFQVHGDGQFHDYELNLSKSPAWRGVITTLRFDPAAISGAQFAVDFIRFESKNEFSRRAP